jgi:hypothetical protein
MPRLLARPFRWTPEKPGARIVPLVQVPVVHHFPPFAHRAFCALANFALVAALFFRLPGFPTLRALVSPASSARADCNRAISASISAMIVSMGGIITAGVTGGRGPLDP